MDYNSLLSCAVDAANASGKHILDALDRPRMVAHKGRTDLVTETDTLSERTIIEHITDAFPSHSILAEESGERESDSDFLWVIDPLDGTTNFVHGYPSFGVSIACLYENNPVVGVVLELPANYLYTAAKGIGAYCNDKPIHVSDTVDLSQSLLVTGFGYEHEDKWHANMDLFKAFTDCTQGVRRLGAASIDLCHVASGLVDGFWEFDLHPWDTAAGILILKEAGGMVTKMDGNDFTIHNQQILASNGSIHEAMLHFTSPMVASLNR